MKKTLYFLIIAAIFSSCLVGKKYHRPDVNVSDNYLAGDSAVALSVDSVSMADTLTAKTDSTVQLNWYDLFNDATLNQLVTQVLDSNANMQIALLRIEQSRANYRIAKADVLPSIGYMGSAQFNDPENLQQANFKLGGTASWELDFFGKLRHAKRAAYADLIASEEGMKAIKTALVSDVAILYFDMRDLDNRIAVAKLTYDSRLMYYNMVNARFLGGDVSELDKLQAEQQLAFVEATLSNLKRQLHYTERSFNILLNQNPQDIPRGLMNEQHAEMPLIPAGLPSTLIEQRPDIIAAENKLKAETERIGVTQAMRFPSFSLTAFFGLASAELSNFATADAMAGSVLGSVMGPIFEFGKNARRVEIQKKETEIALNSYLNTYHTALAEVENALVSIQTYRDEYNAILRQTEAARKALMLTKAKYDNGYSSYLEVLISETYTFDAEMKLSVTKAKQLEATVSLYRALGGGW